MARFLTGSEVYTGRRLRHVATGLICEEMVDKRNPNPPFGDDVVWFKIVGGKVAGLDDDEAHFDFADAFEPV